MRMLVSVLFSAVAVFAEDPQAIAPNSQVPDNLSIPARLSKPIESSKCKAGDAVEMRSLEPVLLSHGLVMPEDAKLHGKVLGAASRQDNQPSWVLLVVVEAEWKQHRVPLHAIVAAQITLKPKVPAQNVSAFENAITRRTAGRVSAPGRRSAAGPTRPPRDAIADGNDAAELSYHGVDDLVLMKDQHGRVFLVSQRPQLKVPSGTMFMLRNQPVVAQEPQEQVETAIMAESTH